MPRKSRAPKSQSMEDFIRKAFEENFARLRFESGHGLSPDIKRAALQQVLAYWLRLREEVADKVTQTEVKLNLPSQNSPDGRKFGIDGVVDIVREGDHTVMYDIKTHAPDYIAANQAEYVEQLNIYAHIWQNLRGQDLDEAAVISTQFPEGMKEALERNDQAALAKLLPEWNPIFPIPIDTSRIDKTIKDFGKVVDQIEDFEFEPLDIRKLERVEVKGQNFATRVCRFCDARFSCGSYRQYVKVAKGAGGARLRKLFGDYGETEDQDLHLDTGAEEVQPPEEILSNL